MLLVFVDETGDRNDVAYLGFSILTINALFYPALKQEIHSILDGIEWNPCVEFKGSYLFSQSKGCSEVQVVKRVEAASKILALNIASANSRMQFHYGRLSSSNHCDDYLENLPKLLKKVLPRPPKGAGKNLLAVVIDERSDIRSDKLQQVLVPSIAERGWVLLERISMVHSSRDTVGLMLADIVGYLSSRTDTISNDAELFEGLTPEQLESNGRLRKLRSSTELISKIRNFKRYQLIATS